MTNQHDIKVINNMVDSILEDIEELQNDLCYDIILKLCDLLEPICGLYLLNSELTRHYFLLVNKLALKNDEMLDFQLSTSFKKISRSYKKYSRKIENFQKDANKLSSYSLLAFHAELKKIKTIYEEKKAKNETLITS